MAKSHTIELAQRLEMLKQAFYHIIATLIYAHIPHYLGYWRGYLQHEQLEVQASSPVTQWKSRKTKKNIITIINYDYFVNWNASRQVHTVLANIKRTTKRLNLKI